jgi:pimeloyl-ACP methyl ester carboxylesterase
MTGNATTSENGHIVLSEAVERFFTPRPNPLAGRDDELLRQGTRLDLDCGLAATAWGSGPSVLFAHGWESRRTHWGAFVTPLVVAGFRAVAVDAPGHGDSPGATSNVLRYGLGLVAVAEELGALSAVVGHSFGAGAIAIALGRGLKADRAVLISGPVSLVAVIERWGRHAGLPERDIPAFVRLVEREVGEPLESLNVASLAQGLSTRALIVHDRHDKEIPLEDGLAVAAAWPGASTLITERYGHRRIMLAADVIAAVVQFVTSP